MPLFEIKSRFDAKVLFSRDCESLKVCVEAGVRAGADLGYADLGSADLRSAVLRYAVLRSADLGYADLRSADLGYANLRSANLRSANLSWSSHDLLAEILRREAGNDIKRRSFAGLIKISYDWCWDTWLKLDVTDELRWAAAVLAKWIKPENTGPHIDAIRKLAKETEAETAVA